MRFPTTLALTLLCFALAAPFARGSGGANWEDFRAYFEKCGEAKKRGQPCAEEIEKLLEGVAMWGDTNSNYNEGRQHWVETKVELAFDARKGEEGDFEVFKKGGKLRPRVSLTRAADASELLITINHEIVHYANSKKLKELFADEKKIGGCLTPFRLALLENEKLAYLSEIYFWKTAPLWFKNEQKRTHFNSRLLGKGKLVYSEYYRLLEDALESDPNFVARRYIDLGKYPKCAAKLLDNNGEVKQKPAATEGLPPGHPPLPQ